MLQMLSFWLISIVPVDDDEHNPEHEASPPRPSTVWCLHSFIYIALLVKVESTHYIARLVYHSLHLYNNNSSSQPRTNGRTKPFSEVQKKRKDCSFFYDCSTFSLIHTFINPSIAFCHQIFNSTRAKNNSILFVESRVRQTHICSFNQMAVIATKL